MTSATDEVDHGRPALCGKVATVVAVGNEDGAHKVIADCFQALDDMGFTIPAGGGTYWSPPSREDGTMLVDQASSSVEMVDEIGIIDDFAAEMSPEQAAEPASFTGYFGTPVAVSDWADPRASCPPNDNPGWYEVDRRLTLGVSAGRAG